MPMPLYSLLPLLCILYRQTSGAVLRQMGRWTNFKSASCPRSSQILRYISYSIGVKCPSCWISLAKMALSAAMLRSVNSSPSPLCVLNILQSWFIRVSRAYVWKEQAHLLGSRQQASRMLCVPMRCHSPIGYGETIMLGMCFRRSCRRVDFPLPMLPSMEQTIFIVNFINPRTRPYMHVSKNRKQSALYLPPNPETLRLQITLPTTTLRTEALIVLLLLCPLPLALLRLHQK